MVWHDARNLSDRTPFGALAAGTGVTLRLQVSRALEIRNVAAILFYDDDRSHPMRQMMEETRTDGDRRIFTTRFVPPRPGLAFYYFMARTDGDPLYIKRDGGHGAKVDGESEDFWQLTVYRPEFVTPDRFKGRLIYQIFPDRFHKSGVEKPRRWQRILREDWGGMPKWQPDADGIYRPNDFFGGDLRGIEAMLPQLEALGVGILYLNPIFEAHTNHRYDTADYTRIDELLGNEEDFRSLCRAAAERDMLILLDGVFSHTGADSVYFNRYGRYGEHAGAYRNPLSDYARWYKFIDYPNTYRSWWGIETLPEVEESRESYLRFITGKDGILSRWMRAGAAGFRLDVADELPDRFLDAVRRRVKEENPEAVLIGEVWEDASNKVAYGERRRYLQGEQLDGVMNYPFRTAILDFVREGDGKRFFDRILSICENYPKPALEVSMNFLSTHDTERAVTALADETANGRGRDWQAGRTLTGEEYARGLRLSGLAHALLFFLPGNPSIYYGDELGMQGYRDPFNRRCYPEDGTPEDPAAGELYRWITRLGTLRRGYPLLRDAAFRPVYADRETVLFARERAGARLYLGIRLGEAPLALDLPIRQTRIGRYEGGLLHFDPPGIFLAEG